MRLHQWAFLSRSGERCTPFPAERSTTAPRSSRSRWRISERRLMGLTMFGGHPGPWDPKEPWDGWWGVNPPFHHPVFVLTHHARAPLELEGGTTFTFVTDGIKAVLERARR